MALLIIFTVVILVAAAILYGGLHWNSSTKDLLARLEAARVSAGPRTYDPRELDPLPAPVQRYFRAALTEGQPLVAAVTVEHAGTFNMSTGGEKWQPFTSRQRVTTQCPGFVWDARIAVAPGLKARVHDAYVEGEGILHATLLGFLTLVNMRGTRTVAEGELMRFLRRRRGILRHSSPARVYNGPRLTTALPEQLSKTAIFPSPCSFGSMKPA